MSVINKTLAKGIAKRLERELNAIYSARLERAPSQPPSTRRAWLKWCTNRSKAVYGPLFIESMFQGRGRKATAASLFILPVMYTGTDVRAGFGLMFDEFESRAFSARSAQYSGLSVSQHATERLIQARQVTDRNTLVSVLRDALIRILNVKAEGKLEGLESYDMALDDGLLIWRRQPDTEDEWTAVTFIRQDVLSPRLQKAWELARMPCSEHHDSSYDC